jgi:hypothetical protein
MAFDDALPFYLMQNQLGAMVEPIVCGIVDGSVDGTLAMLAAFAQLIRDDLFVGPSKVMTTVCYWALARHCFDGAYVRHSEL